jgi:Ca2+-binding EF-hand superfamily protein
LINIGSCQQSFVKNIQNLVDEESLTLDQIYNTLDLENQGQLYENDLRIFLEEQDVLLSSKEARILLNFFDDSGIGCISKSDFFEMFSMPI